MLSQPFSIRTLETSRLSIRSLRPADLDDVHRFQSDAEVVRYLPWEVRTREESRQWLEERGAQEVLAEDDDVVTYAVERRSEGRVIGSMTLFLRSAVHGVAEVGFVLERTAHGQGYAREATAAVLAAAFGDLGAETVIGRADARNDPSAQLMQRLGMREQAAEPEVRVFAVTRDEWRTPHTTTGTAS